MSKNTKDRVPVTEQDMTRSYFKYFNDEMAQVDMEKVGMVLKGPIEPHKALAFKDRDKLLDTGYLETETGYCIMPDGTGYVSNLTTMPGVTVEMFDWWFAWHGLDNLRYKIWDPEDHFQAESMQKHKAFDEDLTIREKYWDTTHEVIEDTGLGPEGLYINFKHPADLGFDFYKIKADGSNSLVCAKGCGKGNPPFASPDTIMAHYVRNVEGGIELRTRFWMGWTVKDGVDFKALPDDVRMPPMGPMALLLHNIKEFTNLAHLLPKIYKEEKDNY